ncbi:uncharacterized protein LOC143566061 [Bidens hawaiensis]|uniref:uncharacterized protein LOC143566061 n=1 Tax=Bidens hawaiensis TaxID=980011 RepID=UPI0040496491
MSAPLNIPLKEIEAVTNSFDDANFIGEGFLGKIYKGQLPLEGGLVDVAVRRLDHSFWLQELAFEKEISILSRLKHRNMVSIVGFCYENNEMLIINERVARGSLSRRLSDRQLTWMRRLQISIGVVRALSYLHNFGIVHHNININAILLDENWEAKISGFEYSMTIPARNLDLAYEKLGMGTYKSDAFSMGIVLFELLCGREAFVSKEDNSFQASSAIFHYENRELHKFVDHDLFSQMDPLSFNVFSKTAYDCLVPWKAPPTMNEIFKRLERALKVQHMYENNEHSTVPLRTIPDHLKLKLASLKHMRIRLDDILIATGNFSKGSIISSGGFGSVYTAELEHVDKEFCLAIEMDNKRQVLKKRSIVAIKNIDDTEDTIAEQGFYSEIEMLTSCKHSNIINLVGFCYERGAMILVYEYASNGSLSYYLQNVKDNLNGGWTQRLKISIDAAKGLSFLHTANGDRREVVHRDIKSANILLDDNLEAKIADFGLSIFSYVGEKHYNTLYSTNVVGTPVYMDPQYRRDAKLKNKSDVYSFGVVLFVILCGTVAYHKKYNNKGLALVGREHFANMEMVDPKIKEDITETLLTSVKGPNQESLDTFTKIAYECLAKAQDDRPTMENVVKELQNALFFQESRKDILRFSPKDTMLALDDGKDCGGWKEYIGKVSHANGNTTTVTVRDYNSNSRYESELEVGRKYRHENVSRILGYYEEEEKRIIVFEHALNGSLDMHLNNPHLTWGKRLKICIGIATGLAFVH